MHQTNQIYRWNQTAHTEKKHRGRKITVEMGSEVVVCHGVFRMDQEKKTTTTTRLQDTQCMRETR